MVMQGSLWDDMIRFSQKLIQTPSLSGEEGEVAQIIQEQMKKSGFSDVWIDPVGNVIGLVKGDRDNPSICFTGHMDTVPSGDEKEWERPPFSGVIAGGYLHGRGTSDMKVSVASQVYIPMTVKRSNIRHGDIYVIEVVQEEVGGIGTKHLDEAIKRNIDYAISGEPTSNKIHIQQKGRVELKVTFKREIITRL
jgi:acetylornithine deacetylase/succinyl-diaminopimelate desuccinylase-like protein